MKKIRYFNLNPKTDAGLITKLNIVAPLERRRPHDLGKVLLTEKLDELIEKHGVDSNQLNVAL